MPKKLHSLKKIWADQVGNIEETLRRATRVWQGYDAGGAQHRSPLLLSNNRVGIDQYQQIILDNVQFTNPCITTTTSSPALTGNQLRQLPLVPLQVPSRGLDQPPSTNLFK